MRRYVIFTTINTFECFVAWSMKVSSAGSAQLVIFSTVLSEVSKSVAIMTLFYCRNIWSYIDKREAIININSRRQLRTIEGYNYIISINSFMSIIRGIVFPLHHTFYSFYLVSVVNSVNKFG